MVQAATMRIILFLFVRDFNPMPPALLFLRPVLLFCLTAFLTTRMVAQEAKVILTGNTSELKNPDLLFDAIHSYCGSHQQDILWVLNGDLFPEKWQEKEIHEWQSRVNHLLDTFPRLQVLLNQGDMDWDDTGKKGWKKIQALEKDLLKNKHARFHLFLQHGCPGPWTFEFTSSVKMVVINSQWWNHSHEKPIPSDGVCSIADTDIFIEELEGILDENDGKNVMVISHFPLESLGNYGGRFAATDYLFPPLAGSIRTGFHQNVGSSKDIHNNYFNAFRLKMQGVLQSYSSVIFSSGHEHNQSILKAGQNFYINSGALSDGDYTASSQRALLHSSRAGFIEVSYRSNGEVGYRLYDPSGGANKENLLMSSACSPIASTLVNTRVNTCIQKTTSADSDKGSEDHSANCTMAIAGEEYKSSAFKEFWLGRHYRRSWTVPVKVPYLNMDTTFGGLTAVGKGGGRQTTSLKFSSENGMEYVFRSVDKDPSKALGYELRGTIVSEFLKDQTTTQQPYGAMTVSYLMDKVHLLHATPELYVLPEHPRLGIFNADYKNLFGMLEVRPTDKMDKEKIFAGADHIEKSFKMFDKLYDDPSNKVDREEFARARMLDLWVGDWSKHEDNWKWAGFKTSGGELFRPVPRDRDHAFSRWDGLLPWLADREWAMPNGENFDYKIRGLKSLMWQARHLDRFVASELTKAQWIKAAKEIQNSITPADIEQAVRKMPEEIYEKDGKEIALKLNARINDLPLYAAQYYNLLAEEVEIVGTNEDEYFHLERKPDGSVLVTVYEYIKKLQQPDKTKVFYQRLFFPNETRELRLFGLNGEDQFVIEGTAGKSILVRIISGGGNDRVMDTSSVKGRKRNTLIYEKEKSTPVEVGSEGAWIKPKDNRFYQYDRANFKYNTYLPIAAISYNQFVGTAVHGGVTFTRHRFSKPDFSARHAFKGAVSTRGNYDLSYANQFRYLAGKWDGISEVMVSRPLNFNYFFGIGNSTIKDTEVPKNYYRTQYNTAAVSAGVTRSFWKRSRLDFIGSYELAEGIQRNNSYLHDHPDLFGTERLHLLFLKANLDLDFRDREALPEHGFRLLFRQQGGHVSQADKSFASISEIEIENYFSTYTRHPLTLGVKMGGGKTLGDLPFYKLLTLGGLNELQGYKRNRFTGQSRAFLNSELRWQMTQTHNTFVPLKIGIRGFFDTGRVWADHDKSEADTWHYGYGGGFYITPFMEQFAFNVSAGRSKEESLLLMISVGAFFR